MGLLHIESQAVRAYSREARLRQKSEQYMEVRRQQADGEFIAASQKYRCDVIF